MELKSPNFQFLQELDPALVKQAALAEHYCLADPVTALTKLRLFAEFLAKNITARMGVYTTDYTDQAQVLRELKYNGYLDHNLGEMFHSIRKVGNDAVHQGIGTTHDALKHLRFAHQLSIHFFKVFQNNNFKPKAFQVPPNPVNATAEQKKLLEDARTQILQLQGQIKDIETLSQTEIQKRKAAEEQAAKAWEESKVAFELAEQTEEQAKQEIALYEEELERIQQTQSAKSEKAIQQTIAKSQEAATQVELTEADTRELIDQQLADAGWQVDSVHLRFSKGVRPEPGKNQAIAEWPTQSGPADYALFVGLKIIGIVEAKKQTIAVSGAIDQAKRYSRDFQTRDSCELSGGPWGDYQIPFAFSTNGKPFLWQMASQSGLWFCDLRRPQNLRKPLESWYSPAGLIDLLRIHVDEAEKRLEAMSFSFDFPIRPYQINAIQAAETAVK